MAARFRFSSAAGLCLALALWSAMVYGASRKNVLVLHNYNQDHPAIALYDQGLRQALQAATDYDVRISAEYLNLASLEQEPGYVADTAAYLVRKYSLWKPDAIVFDNAVVGLYEQYLQRVFADVPWVVPVEEEPGEGARAAPNRIAVTWGVTEEDVEKNLALILRLRPGTKTVYLVLGASAQERRIAQTAAPALAKYADRLTFVVTDTMGHAAMLEAIEQAPGDAVVLYVRFARDASGEVSIPAKVAREVAARAKVPVFCTAGHLLGDGMVGGYVAEIDAFGRFMGGRLLEAFGGHFVGGGEPVRPECSAYVFDGRVLERFGIDAGKLPPGSRVEFVAASLWQTHRDVVLGSVALVVAETFLILGLVLNRLRRKRAEAALVALNVTLEQRVLERTRALHESNEALHEAKDELEGLNRQLEQLSRTDSLTGLPNRRQAEAFAAACHREFERTGQVYTVAMLDIDFFKRVNDRHGHEAGDFLLTRLGREMAALVRSGDMAARWGGEEFLLVLPGVDAAAAGTLLSRVRAGIAAAGFDWRGLKLSATATIGFAAVTPGETLSALLRRADAALYRGKQAGRDRVEAA